jgi:hypothetical protein
MCATALRRCCGEGIVSDTVAPWATAGRSDGRGGAGECRASALGGPGGGDPGDPGPGRGGRGHRGGARARRAQVDRVPAAGRARPAGTRGPGRGAREVPARDRHRAAGRGGRPDARSGAGEPAGLPGAGPGGGRDVSLAILSGRDALYLDQAAGPAALSPHNWAGKRIPLHATSDGKVLLAYLPEAEAAECLAPPLARFTDRTITAPAEFPRLLAEVRRRGFATAVDELEAGLTAVAAPVRNAAGDVAASISTSGPSFRIPAERIPAIAESVRRAAAEISRRMGWADPAARRAR